jgi:hypothetical protein
MALRFSASADIRKTVYITSDESVTASQEAAQAYLSEGDESGLEIGADATQFIIKPLSLEDREKAEVRAGAHTRSELGRLLHDQKPADEESYARWHHKLEEDERAALGRYSAYLNQCYYEIVRAGLVEIVGIEGDPYKALMSISPEPAKIGAIMELVCHIQRLSLLSSDEKKN